MVNLVAAIRENPLLVETPIQRINSYCDWTLEQRSIQPPACDIAAVSCHLKGASRLFAVLIFASVGIAVLTVDSFVLEIFESKPEFTPVAPFISVAGRTVD